MRRALIMFASTPKADTADKLHVDKIGCTYRGFAMGRWVFSLVAWLSLASCEAGRELPQVCDAGWRSSVPTAENVLYSNVRRSVSMDEVAAHYADHHLSMMRTSFSTLPQDARELSNEFGRDAAQRVSDERYDVSFARTEIRYLDGTNRITRIMCLSGGNGVCTCLPRNQL